jgi:hyperosmotically inducible periplasmic protein
MIRLLFRLVIVVVLVVAGAFLYLGYWAGNRTAEPSAATTAPASTPATGTSGKIDTAKARERGAEIGERTAAAAAKAQETMAEAAISAKIMSKMALDDSVKARAIRVSTDRSTVTLSGTVGTTTERDRAIALARETDGVTSVVDRLTVAR